jgi:hypothetical protein
MSDSTLLMLNRLITVVTMCTVFYCSKQLFIIYPLKIKTVVVSSKVLKHERMQRSPGNIDSNQSL